MNKSCHKCNTENPLDANYCRICGSKFNDKPEVSEFRLNAVYRIGDVVDLSWNVSNVDKIMLNGIDVTDRTRKTVKIEGDKVYKLVAIKGENKIEKIIDVHPKKEGQPPQTLTHVPSVSLFKRKKWSFIVGLLAITVLFTIHYCQASVSYYLHLGYSEWQEIKLVINLLCWILLLCSMVSIVYSKLSNDK